MDGTARTLALAAIGIAGATIAGAWAFELIGGLEPCALCLTQRNPYYIGISLALAGLFALARGLAGPARLLWLATAVIFVVGAGYGVYHSGVEWTWWPGPTACSAGSTDLLGTGDLLTQLQTARVVRCDEVQWRLAGLTFANYNVLISLLVAGLALMAARRALDHGSSSLSQ